MQLHEAVQLKIRIFYNTIIDISAHGLRSYSKLYLCTQILSVRNVNK